jgi:hypothetical protein
MADTDVLITVDWLAVAGYLVVRDRRACEQGGVALGLAIHADLLYPQWTVVVCAVHSGESRGMV